MNTIQKILHSHHLQPICNACAQAILYRTRIGQMRYFSSLYQPRYNSDEQKQILQVLNESSAEELARYSVSKGRVNSLQRFRRKHGEFCTLDQVLEVDGLGIKVLEKLCDSILNESYYKYESSPEKSELKEVKSNKNQILIPVLPVSQKIAMKSVVGIHMGVNAMTWAHVNSNGELLDWNLFDLKFGSRKLHLTSLFEVAQRFCKELPRGDLYVIEDKVFTIQSFQQQPSSVPINLQNSQLFAMTVALLNTHSIGINETSDEHQHCVYFLRSRLPARLFGALIGAERVSPQTVVLDILTESEKNVITGPTNLNASAKIYTPIRVDKDMIEEYLNRTNVEKESLCWSLLLTMTFMDLVVYQNPHSWKVI